MRTDYEQLAGRYDDDRAKWSFPPDDVIDELVTTSGPDALLRVLDLGCGTGRWLAAQQTSFDDANVEWIGVDPSAAMLDEASAKGLSRLLRGRAEDLPLPSSSIDYIASSYAFHHFGDKDRALDEVHRALTETGVFRINNIEPAAAEDWWIYQYFPETVAIDAARFWSASRIGDALRARHYDVDVQLESGPRQIPAAEALEDAERRVVSQLALLDDAAYERGLALLRSDAAAADSMVTTTRSRLQLTARRSP